MPNEIHAHVPRQVRGQSTTRTCKTCDQRIVWSIFDNAYMTLAEWQEIERERKALRQ